MMNSTLQLPIYQICWRASPTMDPEPLFCVGFGETPHTAEWRAIDCAWWVGPSCSLTCRTHAANQVEPRSVFSGSKMIDDWLVRSFLPFHCVTISRYLPTWKRQYFRKLTLCYQVICVFHFCERCTIVFLVKYIHKSDAYSKIWYFVETNNLSYFICEWHKISRLTNTIHWGTELLWQTLSKLWKTLRYIAWKNVIREYKKKMNPLMVGSLLWLRWFRDKE
jgi:hypothetical protein